MSAFSIGGSVPVDFVYSRDDEHGAGGWTVQVARSLDGSKIAAVTDVPQAYVKNTLDADWNPILRPDNLPARYSADNGGIMGSHHIEFGGASNTRLYIAVRDGILRSDTAGAGPWLDTACVDLSLSTFPGGGAARFKSSKGVKDPTNQDVFFASFQQAGVKGTRDGGATAMNMDWLPKPITLPGYEVHHGQTIMALNPDNPLQIAFAPWGQGVWQTNDGGYTGEKVSTGAGAGILAACDVQWRDNNLFIAQCRSDNYDYTPVLNNLWRRTPAGGWTNFPAALEGQLGVDFIVPDSRNPAWWILTTTSSAFWHTKNIDDPASWKGYVGGGESDQYSATGTFRQMKARKRPLIARKYRNGGGTGACSKPVIASGFLFWPLGYGPVRTPIADFPTEGASFGNMHPSPAWPTFEEDTARIEEICGRSALDTGKAKLLLAQDVPLMWQADHNKGHRFTYRAYPSIGFLSNGVCATQSPLDPDFVVAAMYKGGNKCGFSKDGGVTMKPFPVQPPVFNTGPSGPGGAIVAGPTDEVVNCPSYAGVPSWTRDCGASAWSPIVFRINGVAIDLSDAVVGYGKHGFHGWGYSENHHQCVIDSTGTYWFLNVGAGRAGFPENDWEQGDPLGYAGLYRMRPQDFPNAHRVIAGPVSLTGNRGYYACRFLPNADASKMIFMPNPVPGAGGGNYLVGIDTVALTKAPITLIENVQWLDLGAPLTPGGPQPLYLLGRVGGVYGFYISLDFLATAPIGPFNHKIARGGAIVQFSASKTVPGEITAAIDGMGHASGILRAA